MSQHTPGPWSINEWPQRDAEIRIGAANTPLIATVHLRDESINGQKANAHLIAAAPELLQLAKQYASECAECAGRGALGAPGNDRPRIECPECKFIRDLIRRATP